jgi:HD superfamily phosphohydrolase
MDTKSPRIRTILYDDEHLSQGELDLLHTPALQRLYDLHQLGLTDRIYIDASHSRLHHVVGVLEQTDKLVDAITRNLERSPRRSFHIAQNGSDFTTKIETHELLTSVQKNKSVIRLIGLLHDLTHAPYGHTIEDEIHLVACKHDEPARQSEVFYQLVCQYLGWLALEAGVRPPQDATFLGRPPHGGIIMPPDFWNYLGSPELPPPADFSAIAELAGSLMRQPTPGAKAAWRRKPEEIAELLAQLSCAMRALLYLEVLHARDITEANCPHETPYAFERLISATLATAGMTEYESTYKFDEHRDAYMLDVIGNTVCADLLDYAQRDAHFAGLRLGYDAERIAENFTLVTGDLGKNGRPVARNDRPHEPAGVSRGHNCEPRDPFSGKSIRTAISLYSHKLRTDVPSELMNLLNVRFYIYERALYHPTKCAADAMLGTALQFMGWRPLREEDGVSAYELPAEFRNVGDAVFLHDLIGGGRIALDALQAESTESPTVRIEECKRRLNQLSCSQTRVAALILTRWDKLNVAEAKRSLYAGLELLNRLTARRFYKAVFRNLPNSKNKRLRKKPEDLANVFKNPVTRFEAEREIEDEANLRRGTVVIHCPRRITAQKVANVLLVFPTDDGEEETPTRLRDIKELDEALFGAHQEAITAVEKMYESMWRLVVYVAPEALARYPDVMRSAGKVIFNKMDEDNCYPDDEGWKNDEYLVKELDQKFGNLPKQSAAESGAIQANEDQVSATAEIVTELEVAELSVASGDGAGSEVEAADVTGPDIEVVHQGRRRKWVMTVRQVWRSNKRDRLAEDFYESELREMSDQDFEELVERVKSECASVPPDRRQDFWVYVRKTRDNIRAKKAGPLLGNE